MKTIKVWWTDPDDGACSRFYDPVSIRFFRGEMIEIKDVDGSYKEVWPHELSWPADMFDIVSVCHMETKEAHAHGFYVWTQGSVWVQGSKDEPYIVRKDGDHYSCTCGAWRYQEPEIKTCKHLKKLRGEEAEKLRVGENYK